MSGADRQRFGPAPRPVLIASSLSLAFCIAMIIVGAWTTGATWDEAYHVERFQNYLRSGWYLIDAQMIHGHPGPGVTDQFVYGPATMWLLHGWNLSLGIDPVDGVSVSATAYAARHVAIAVISLLGVAATAAIGRLLFGRWGWGIVSASVLAVIPLWTGHSMFNVKDVPVATGYTLITLGLCLILREDRGVGWACRLQAPACLALGTYLAMGTRPGMWTAVLASLVMSFVLVGLRPTRQGERRRWLRRHGWRATELIVGLASAGGLLAAVYPKVYTTPVTTFYESAVHSANFLGISASRAFVPAHLLLEVPVILGCFLALGVVLAVRELFRRWRRPLLSESCLALVLVQAFALPLVTVVHPSGLYSDLRQLLFATPAGALLITYGLVRLLERARVAPDRLGARLVAIAAISGVVIPALDQATLFPYNYAYSNVLTHVAQVSPPGDYYRASGRELTEFLPSSGRVVCSPVQTRDGRVTRLAHLDGAQDCALAVASPLSPYASARGGRQPALKRNQFWAVSFASPDVPKNCVLDSRVTRRHSWRMMVMSQLMLCTMPFPVLPPGGVSFGVGDAGQRYLDLGWFTPGLQGERTGTRAIGAAATIRFRLSPADQGRTLQLRLQTALPARPVVRLDGHRLTTRPMADETGVTARLSADLVGRPSKHAYTLRFTMADGHAPLILKSLILTKAATS